MEQCHQDCRWTNCAIAELRKLTFFFFFLASLAALCPKPKIDRERMQRSSCRGTAGCKLSRALPYIYNIAVLALMLRPPLLCCPGSCRKPLRCVETCVCPPRRAAVCATPDLHLALCGLSGT